MSKFNQEDCKLSSCQFGSIVNTQLSFEIHSSNHLSNQIHFKDREDGDTQFRGTKGNYLIGQNYECAGPIRANADLGRLGWIKLDKNLKVENNGVAVY